MRRLTSRRFPTIARNRFTPRGVMPIDPDYEMAYVNDTVYDEPREPVIIPTGVYGPDGGMMVKVKMPVKVPCGFHIPGKEAPADPNAYYATMTMSEHDVAISEAGLGMSYLTPAEADEWDEEPSEDATTNLAVGDEIDGVPVIGVSQSGKPVVKLSDVLTKLAQEGIAVAIDLEGLEDGKPS